MPVPRLTEEQLQAAVDAMKAHGTQTAAASALNLSRGALQDRLRQAAARGLMGFKSVLPGFVVKETSEQQDADGNTEKQWIRQTREPGDVFEVPTGHTIKGVSALLDPEGRELAKWVKTREGDIDPLQMAEWLKGAFADVVPTSPIAAPATSADDLLTLLPCGDWHLGMFAWSRETGENWDLKIAEDTIGRAVTDTVSRSPQSACAIVLGGGDLFHADNKKNQTAKSGHALDVDGRYQKVVEAANRLMVRTIDANLRHHGQVIVRLLPGNHDEHACVAVTYYLLAHYRDEPRVTVDTDPSLFFWHRFGQVLLGATHGHEVKISKLGGVMAQRRAADWGVTKFRYAHGFHLHHSEKKQDETNGVLYEIHRAPVPPDAWHFGAGFLSGRSIQALTYHRNFGSFGRVETPIMDGGAT